MLLIATDYSIKKVNQKSKESKCIAKVLVYMVLQHNRHSEIIFSRYCCTGRHLPVSLQIIIGNTLSAQCWKLTKILHMHSAKNENKINQQKPTCANFFFECMSRIVCMRSCAYSYKIKIKYNDSHDCSETKYLSIKSGRNFCIQI